MKRVILVMLLVAAMAGCQVTMLPTDPNAVAKAGKKKAEAETVERIRRYKIVKEEQQLVTDILKIRYEAALLKAKFNPTSPKVEPPRIPQSVPPAEAKE